MGDSSTPARPPAPATRDPGSGSRSGAAGPRRHYHIGVAIGLSAGVYAGSLAAVTMLQVDHDKGLIADRRPVGDAIALLGEHHDAMAADLELASLVYEEASRQYGAVVSGVGDLHDDVERLGKAVSRIEGSALRVPSRIALPAVPRTPRTVATAPTAHGTTGASGKP